MKLNRLILSVTPTLLLLVYMFTKYSNIYTTYLIVLSITTVFGIVHYLLRNQIKLDNDSILILEKYYTHDVVSFSYFVEFFLLGFMGKYIALSILFLGVILHLLHSQNYSDKSKEIKEKRYKESLKIIEDYNNAK